MEDNHAHDHEQHGHIHDHSNLSGKKIFWVTVLNAIITVAEIIGGILSGSLALLSDALHNLSDTIAIALSYFANRFAQKSRDEKRTYGYKRAEILAAFVNATVLLALSVLLIIEAFKRWQSPETINGMMMIAVALVGLIANFISVFLYVVTGILLLVSFYKDKKKTKMALKKPGKRLKISCPNFWW